MIAIYLIIGGFLAAFFIERNFISKKPSFGSDISFLICIPFIITAFIGMLL